MRVMSYKHNDSPEKGSRPMSETAAGFVPGSGAGALVLESLESALERKATIYAEVLGGDINSGGQRNGGTLTAPNSEAVQRCITNALVDAQISSNEIDLINGHLTATSKDALEIENWTKALQRKGTQFPYINSLKSMVVLLSHQHRIISRQRVSPPQATASGRIAQEPAKGARAGHHHSDIVAAESWMPSLTMTLPPPRCELEKKMSPQPPP